MDVGTDCITVTLVKEDSGRSLRDVRHAALPPGTDPADILQQLVRPLNRAGSKVHLAFSPGFFLFRTVVLPFSDPHKIVQILPFEMGEQMPCSIDDYVLDYILCGQEDGGHRIVVAALARETIEEWLTICRNTGLVPEAITVCNVELCKMITETGNADFLLLDCGHGELSLYLVRQGEIVFIRSLPFFPEDDENLPGMFAAGIRRALLLSEKCAPAESCRLPLFYIINRAAGDRRIETLLTRGIRQGFGGEADIRYIDEEMLAQITGKNGSGMSWQRLFSACGSGISSSSPEFMQGKFRPVRGRGGAGRKMLFFLALFVCSSLVFAGLQFYEYRRLTEKVRALREEIHSVFRETRPDVKRIVNPVHQLQTTNNEIRSMYSQGNVGREAGFSMLEILAELSARIPASYNVIIVRLVAEASSLRIKGETPDFNTVDNVQKLLEESPYFSSVEISSANHAAMENIVRFELKIRLSRQVDTT